MLLDLCETQIAQCILKLTGLPESQQLCPSSRPLLWPYNEKGVHHLQPGVLKKKKYPLRTITLTSQNLFLTYTKKKVIITITFIMVFLQSLPAPVFCNEETVSEGIENLPETTLWQMLKLKLK